MDRCTSSIGTILLLVTCSIALVIRIETMITVASIALPILRVHWWTAWLAGHPDQLLVNLTEHEYRTRYRTRRELRSHPAAEVIPAVKKWVGGLGNNDPKYGRHILEGLWATWGQNQVDQDLLELCLNSDEHAVRAGAVRVLRYTHYQVPNSQELFLKAAGDEHPRVRLEAVVAASWLDNDKGAEIALEGMKHPVTKWMGRAYESVLITLDDDIRALSDAGKIALNDNPAARSYLAGSLELYDKSVKEVRLPQMNLSKENLVLYKLGEEVYQNAHRYLSRRRWQGNDTEHLSAAQQQRVGDG